MRIKQFLFKNIGLKQTIAKNTFWLGLAETIGRILNIVLLIYVARIFGATEYGKFSFALAFVSLIAIIADLGLYEIVTREFSKSKNLEKEYSSIISLKILLSLLSLGVMVAGSFFITKDPVVRLSIWLLSFFIIITSFFNIIYAFCRARQKMEYEALSTIGQMFFITVIGFIVILKFPSVINLSIGYLLANIIICFFVIVLFNKFVYPIRISFHATVIKKFMASSWPLTFGLAIGWIYIFINSVVMGYMGKITEAGWYNAAYKILGALVISSTLISRSFYPALSKLYGDSKVKFLEIWRKQIEIMGIMIFPILMGGFILAPKIIDFFYGQSYNPAIIIFRILLFVSMFDFLYYPYAMSIVVSGNQNKLFYNILFGVIVNTVLTVLLVPRYSYYGAGAAAIVSSLSAFLLIVAQSAASTRIFPINYRVLKSFLYYFISSIVMSLVISNTLIYHLNIFFTVMLGAFVYFGLLSIFYRKSLKTMIIKIKAI